MSTDQPRDSRTEKEGVPFHGQIKRVANAVWLTSVVVLALLTFPHYVLWMVAGWLGWHSLAVWRKQPGWAPLVACLCILLAKRVYLAPAMLGLLALAIVVAVSRAFLLERQTAFKRFAWIGSWGLWIVWGYALIDFQAAASCSRHVPLDPDRSVVCLGDSITSGLVGEVSYPSQLGRIIGPRVVNLGRNGITTEMAFDLLPRIVEADPQIVVIELGGHDFLKGRTRAETKRKLQRLIAACRIIGSEVVLFEIPRGFITDPFAGLEREIARELDLELIGDSTIRNLVLWSPISPPGMWMPSNHLSEDGIHPNERGTEFLAHRVADSLVRIYGEGIRRQRSDKVAISLRRDEP